MWFLAVLLMALAAYAEPVAGTKQQLPGADVEPGPIERQWRAKPHGRAEPVPCFPGKDLGITEIAIEHTECFGKCPIYTFTFKSDGTAIYYGQRDTPFIGTRIGRVVDPFAFERLAMLVLDFGLPQMGDNYACAATDLPTTYLSVVYKGQRKIIRSYGSGPPRIAVVASQLAAIERGVSWQHP